MLRITPAYSAQAATDYHLAGLARADYYMGQDPSVWQGKGAALLGLAGMAVTRHDFAALTEGYHPLTGEKLIQRFRQNRRVGYGLTFNAPKSLTLVYEYTRDERILEAVNAAVREVMAALERAMQTRSYDRKGQPIRPVTGNLTWASFLDFESRPLASDSLPDPHLHNHIFAFAPTFYADKECWQAGEFGGIKADGAYYEALFHGLLARHVRALGYDVSLTDGGRWWEIAGISRRLIDKFSRRTAEIADTARAHGITAAAELDRLGARTRQGKGDYTLSELREIWRARLTDADIRELENAGKTGTGEDTVTAREAVAFALDKTLERASAVELKPLLTEALRFAAGRVAPGDLEAALQQDHILRVQDGEHVWITTKAVAEEERALCAAVREGVGTCEPLMPSSVIAHQSPERRHSDDRRPVTDDGITLTESQQRAVDHILTARDAVIAVRGVAGSGKTTMLRRAVGAMEDAGRTVFACAPTTAATDVLREEGFAGAATLQKLLASQALQEAVRGQVILVDEAGLVGVRQMKQLMDIAARQKARVILVGDEYQHGSVERSDVNVLRILRDHAGLVPAAVTEIKRQHWDEYREAVAALSHADIAAGFARLEAMGALREMPDHMARYTQLAADYFHALDAGKSAFIIAPSHAEGDMVTAIVRDGLKARGALTAQDYGAQRLKNLSWTVAARRHGAFYSQKGLMIEFTQNARGFQRGARLLVTGFDEGGHVLGRAQDGQSVRLPLDQAERFQVYEVVELDLAVGEEIRFTRNGCGVNGEPLVNGEGGRIAAFEEGHIRLEDGTLVPGGFGHLEYGYVSTSHKAQGRTADAVFIAENPALGAASPEQLYVSASRARETVRIYTPDKDALLGAVSRERPALSATALAGKIAQQEEQARIVQERHAHIIDAERRHRDWQRRQELSRQWPQGRLRRIWTRERCRGWGLATSLCQAWDMARGVVSSLWRGAPEPGAAGT